MCRVPGTLCSKYGYVVCCAVESTGPACLDEGSSERFSIHACFRYDVSRYLAAPNSELIALSIDYHSHHLTSRAFGISSSGTSRGTPIKCYYSAVSPAQQSPVFFLENKATIKLFPTEYSYLPRDVRRLEGSFIVYLKKSKGASK